MMSMMGHGPGRHGLGPRKPGGPTYNDVFGLLEAILDLVLASHREFLVVRDDPSVYWMSATAWGLLATKAAFEHCVRQSLTANHREDSWAYSASTHACGTVCAIALPMALLEAAMQRVRDNQGLKGCPRRTGSSGAVDMAAVMAGGQGSLAQFTLLVKGAARAELQTPFTGLRTCQ